MDNIINIENNFKFSGELTRRKLIQYLPAMLMTNLSTLLLVSVDGLVVGNLVGENALSSVNIFYPATLVISIFSALLSFGASARLAEAMGQIDLKGLLKIRATMIFLMVAMAVFVGLIQIPIVAGIISSYHLSPEMNSLVWSYAIGVMISMPFGIISSVGVLQLQVIGKMNVLMGLSITEGIANLLLDLLFVGPLGMGVAGAGYGTAGANIIRCGLTILYLAKKTDMYYTGGEKVDKKEISTILFRGFPEAANMAMMAAQNYMMVAIILSEFGEAGGVIKGTVTFAFSLGLVITGGVSGAMRPLTGLLSGAMDLKGLRLLMKQGLLLITVLSGALLIAMELFPGTIYTVHGVDEIPAGGMLSLRFAVLSIVFTGINTLFRLYFTNRRELRFSTILTIVGNATLPGFAVLLTIFYEPSWIWLAYLLSQTVILLANLLYYRRMQKKDREMLSKDETVLYLTVVPEEAIDASRQLRKYAEEAGINRKYAFRVALCMEEMVAYAVKSHNTKDISLQIMIRFFEDGALLMIIDDGKSIIWDREEEKKKIITTNYGLLKKLSKNVEYQYILNMNYTVCKY